MHTLFALLSLLGLFSFSQQLLRIRFAYAPLVSLSIVGTVLFFSILTATFSIIAVVIAWIGLAAWLCCLLQATLYRSARALIPMAYYAGILLICSSLSLLGHHPIHFGDELHFWGLLSKHIFLYHKLPSNDYILQFRDYPPGVPLFNAWINTLFGFFSDKHMYFGQQLLLASCILSLSAYKSAKQTLLVITLTIIILSLFNASFLYSLYVDTVLACLFASLLIMHNNLNNNSNPNYWLMLPVLTFMLTTKQAGMLLAFFILCLIAMQYIISSIHSKHCATKPLISFVACVLAAIMISLIWRGYLTAHGIHITFNQQQTISPNLRPTVIKHFLYAFFISMSPTHQYLNRLYLSPFVVLILFALTYYQLNRLSPQTRSNWVMTAIVFIGFISYSTCLLVLYLYHFVDHEALIVASMGRYLSIYMIAWALLVSSQITAASKLTSKASQVIVTTLATVVAALVLFTGFNSSHQLQHFAEPSATLAKQLRNRIDFNKANALFVINQTDDPILNQQIIRYQFYPQMPYCSNLDCYNSQQLCDQLKTHHYLLVIRTNSSFAQKYPLIATQLQTHKPQLYRVQPNTVCVHLVPATL